MSSTTTTVTWHLERSKPNDVELIVKPHDYDSWLPVPGRDELNKGNVMTINLELRGKNGKPLNVKAESFELHLNNTSKEPGITINYPVDPGSNQLPDLRLLLLPNIESVDEGQSLSVSSTDGISGKAYIGSYDGGGWSTLTAEAILNDGHHTRLQGRLLVSNGETEILIPKRNPNSKIGEYWSKANGNPADNDDNESYSGNNNKGDGLSAYEEYRGVISENEFGSKPGKFGRLDPSKKELGIKLDKAQLSLFEQGIKWFENGSKLKVIKFYEGEIGGDRRFNKNSSYAHIYDQYTLVLYKGLLADLGIGSPLGCTFKVGFNFKDPAKNDPDIPANTASIVIDPDAVNKEYNTLSARYSPERLPFTASELFSNTVAHELGHGVNVAHHGQTPGEISPVTATAADKSPYYTFRVFNRQGVEITDRPYTINGLIGKSGDGTLESGDISCFMAYVPYYNWAFTRGADFARIYNQVPLTPLGQTMCVSEAGTGFNHSIIFFGNAVPGNCVSQVKLKP